ncbi:MAG: phosphate ABC transporter, permease protein PstA, partial [Lachnospiraceae bacterium]
NGLFEGLTSPGATLTVALYLYAKEEGEFEVAFAIAAILMILTLFINLMADLAGKYFKKRRNA